MMIIGTGRARPAGRRPATGEIAAALGICDLAVSRACRAVAGTGHAYPAPGHGCSGT